MPKKKRKRVVHTDLGFVTFSIKPFAFVFRLYPKKRKTPSLRHPRS